MLNNGGESATKEIHYELQPLIAQITEDFELFVNNFAAESDEVDLRQLQELAKTGGVPVSVKKYRDALYLGQLNPDGKRHYKGIMIYANGRRYEGNWFNDVRHGRGFEKHPN